MQWVRSRAGTAGILGLGLCVMLGAAPATSTYHQVVQRIDEAKQALTEGGSGAEKAGDWGTFFDAVIGELEAQATAETAADRLAHLERLGRMRDALATKSWGPSDRTRAALADWLEPRLGVARALRDLESAVAELPGRLAGDADEAETQAGEGPGADEPPDRLDEDSEPADEEVEASDPTVDDRAAPEGSHAAPVDRDSALKQKWATYVDRLNQAVRDYEGAESVADRLNASRKLRGGLASLRQTQASYPWAPAQALSAELDRLLDRPNVQVVADAGVLSPFLNQYVVNPEVIYFKGQTSYVQPGPKTGFGLMDSADGIAFYNSQWSYSTTPVNNFQQQVAQDPQGRQATNMYYFGATIYNTNHVTATAVLTPDGLFVYPQNAPNVSAAFGASPKAGFGPGLTRAVAGLIGYDRQRILSELQQQALPQIRAETAQGTQELAAIKSAEQAGQINSQIRQFLVGNRTLRFQDFAMTELAFASNPTAAYINGVLQWAADGGPQVGADFPQPPEFARPDSGLTLDVHLNSVLTNLAAGYFRSDQASEVENLLVKIVPPEGEAPPGEGLEVVQNASYEDLLKAIEDVRSQSDSPEAVALRVSKPGEPPAFAVDSEGNLVVFVRDLTIEVPAPEDFGNRGLFGFASSPRVLRFIIEEAEITLAADFEPQDGGRTVKVVGQVESVTYGGAGTTVVAVGDTEDDTTTLNLLNRSGALGVLAGKLQGQDVDTSVPTDQLQGFLISSISDLDPTGWMRVVLQRDPTQPVPSPAGLTTATTPAAPAPAAQPALVPTGYAAQ
ncbi:hypothetical protein [Tautonia plasticadhaerens]|uniref:Uncharacterized protein n=1 Tax=Tautonia plasticadhaerens TaxID=2527974 RepID=A0A518HAV7_9BACT|nr:hypothetical protein [Tautonia plasticadhaerens]QDV37969.1 hypothetical protein ElP_59160 [Tautonia plasticadhaerens]